MLIRSTGAKSTLYFFDYKSVIFINKQLFSLCCQGHIINVKKAEIKRFVAPLRSSLSTLHHHDFLFTPEFALFLSSLSINNQ